MIKARGDLARHATILLLTLLLAAANLFLSSPCSAQSFGIAALLNPEGSRLFPQTIILPRHPGKPDPRWRSFNWRHIDLKIDSATLRLYFYEDEDWIVSFVVPMLREQVTKLGKIFGYMPQKRFAYLLFNSQREFQQANVFNISEGVQGVTSTDEATMAIPYWGDVEAFKHVSTHELVHQFQVQLIGSLSENGGTPVAMLEIPLWFIEGMAEYHSQGGVDPETRFFIRDLIVNPDTKREHVLPKFLEQGAMNFIQVYKVGQAKIDFLEKQFGPGMARRILALVAKRATKQTDRFDELLCKELGQTKEQLEQRWQDYIRINFKDEANKLTQDLKHFEKIPSVGKGVDFYDISPDGAYLATREMDQLTGAVSIRLTDFRNPKDKEPKSIQVTHDNQPGVLSLYFLRHASIALSDSAIVYMVETTSGPEIELRNIVRNMTSGNTQEIKLEAPTRFRVHELGLTEAHSPALSPDGNKLAFVGLTKSGKPKVLVIDLKMAGAEPQTLVEGYYAWKNLTWSDNNAILAASNRTANGKFQIMHIDPKTGAIKQLTFSDEDEAAPDSKARELYFQSWQDRTLQIHRLGKNGVQHKLTAVKTSIGMPKFRQNSLFALGFSGGLYGLYRLDNKHLLSDKSFKPLKTAGVWEAKLEPIASGSIERYHPFNGTRLRLDQVGGFFASGNFIGIGATFSDLMRDYSITGEFSILGELNLMTTYLFLSSQRGRSTWSTGGYHLVQPRLDNVFDSDSIVRTYLHREFGVLGALQYPLGAFSFLDFELRLAGVKRSAFSDQTLLTEWNDQNPGIELLTAPVLRFGYDRILYELYTGPIKGSGVLLESDTSVFLGRGAVSERMRLDLAHYIQVLDRSVLTLQGVVGASWGDKYGNTFLVSSDDILRAYLFADDRLRGNYLVAAKSEFRFPVGSLFSFNPLRGLVGYDLGTVFRQRAEARTNIASSYTAGMTFNLPPISINLMFSYPILTAPGPVDRPILHFTLRYLYL